MEGHNEDLEILEQIVYKSRILHLSFYKILKLIENIMERHNEDLDKEDI